MHQEQTSYAQAKSWRGFQDAINERRAVYFRRRKARGRSLFVDLNGGRRGTAGGFGVGELSAWGWHGLCELRTIGIDIYLVSAIFKFSSKSV